MARSGGSQSVRLEARQAQQTLRAQFPATQTQWGVATSAHSVMGLCSGLPHGMKLDGCLSYEPHRQEHSQCVG